MQKQTLMDAAAEARLSALEARIEALENAPKRTRKPKAEEPARQLYFMEILKLQVAEMSKRLGRPLISHVATFGCQMNVTSEI